MEYLHKVVFIPGAANREIELEVEELQLPMDINADNAFDKLRDMGITTGYSCPQNNQLVEEGEIYEGEFGNHAVVPEDIFHRYHFIDGK